MCSSDLSMIDKTHSRLGKARPWMLYGYIGCAVTLVCCLARDEAERSLVRMTAQMPIRFTHIALGGDAGPHWASGFVSGSVTDAEAVKQSAVYQGAVRDHPEITNWATLCVVYVGRGLPSALGTVDASDFDLEIMNRTGNRFLDEYGVRWLSGPYQMTVAAAPAESLDGSALFQMGHTM